MLVNWTFEIFQEAVDSEISESQMYSNESDVKW